ncbi:MAG: hypothetical protein IIA83_02160 [Thaumarchaeota archaeon]|nr:hypothetical protein [Nitrososphaerota archaeon]
MASYRKYRRDLTVDKIKTLKIWHKIHLKNKGFLTKLQKERLLKIKKKERKTLDADFWYRIKHSAKYAIFDLELISKIADESQLQEIFEPFTSKDYNEQKKGNYYRTSLRNMIESIFTSHIPEKSNRNNWRFKIALEMVTIGIGYVRNMPSFQSKLHTRLFEDVLDVLDENRDSGKSAFA